MSDPRTDLAAAGARLAALGLSPGSSGNLSVRVDDRILITPTGADLADVDPDGLSVLDLAGTHLDGPRPSKEFPLHSAFYRRGAGNRAVVHLHARNATAVSCLPPWSVRSAVPPLTPYFVMRVGQTPLVPYAPPGDADQAEGLARLPFPFRAALLQNHGPVLAGPSMARAVDAAVELEEVSALLLALGERSPRLLTPEEAGALGEKYDSPWGER
ncbi:class II aldolase/adducin family protein [Streptomyces sp. QL37]|uniref:class II aldolase/adducin family protein n=1 Tax=Streptomyces sp. QL37 TaxID=2093747 RepID=UPI000CF2C36D|nr:class II aldolase/adducin family protein [Streptomyces sp. QL37]PPQ61584.1 aldolase [Streptomyces sp. QL37]